MHGVRWHTATWLLAACLTGLLACQRDESSPQRSDNSAPTRPALPSAASASQAARSAAPLALPGPHAAAAEAPQDWPSFLIWCQDELDKTPPAVPLPSQSVLPEARWPVRRLGDELAQAEIRCDWKPSEPGGKALVDRGPYRSDTPIGPFNARIGQNEDGRRVQRILFAALEQRRQDVGAIELEMRVPAGDYVDLIWDRGGQLRIPVATNKDFVHLRIDTHGFSMWSGALQRIELNMEPPPPGAVVEIRRFRLLSVADAFVEPVGYRPVTVDRRQVASIFVHGVSEVRYTDLAIGTHAAFSASIARGPAARGRENQAQPIDFEVVLEVEGQESVLVRETLSPTATWRDVQASLEPWAGRRATLALRTRSDDPGAVGFWGEPVVYQRADDAPIVVLYLIDTVSAKHLSLYGYARETMPRLTQFAQGGMWFSRMYCNAPLTVCSVPNFLLSMSTERHGVIGPSEWIPDELVTVAESLRAGGFATASFITNVNAGPMQRSDQGFDSVYDRIAFLWEAEADRTVPIEDVVAWSKAHAGRPQLIYIHTAEPHAPYTPKPGFKGVFDPDYSGTFDGSIGRFMRAREPRDVQHIVALYDEELLYADSRLGAFVDALAAAGLGSRATIFVFSDHGEEFLEHGRWAHGNALYDEVLRVPWVAFGPLVRGRGACDIPAQLMDIYPTVLDLLDFPQPYTLQGASLAPILRGDAADASARGGLTPQRDIYSSNLRYYKEHGIIERCVVEGGRWKLYYRLRRRPTTDGGAPHGFLLFDLAADPAEQHNVIESNQDVARRLMGKLLAYAREQHPFARGPADALQFDAEQLHNLKALGYIGGGEEDEDEGPYPAPQSAPAASAPAPAQPAPRPPALGAASVSMHVSAAPSPEGLSAGPCSWQGCAAPLSPSAPSAAFRAPAPQPFHADQEPTRAQPQAPTTRGAGATASRPSVKPGINDAYRTPDVGEWVQRLETESREVFHERQRIVDDLGLQAGMVVADIGAGTGAFTGLLSAKVGPAGKVYAVDIAEEFLARIRQRAAAEGWASVQTVRCPEDSVALPAESIDLAYLCDTYHHFEYPESSLRSIFAALKPGGQLVVVDFERLPGVSEDWILGHVRAGRDQVISEIAAAGFKLLSKQAPTAKLSENYFLRFEKPLPTQTAPARASE